MRRWIPILAVGALVALSASPAAARSAKDCAADYAAKKAELGAAGTKKADFMTACRAPVAAAVAAKPGSIDAAPVITKTKQQCTAEYNANKRAIEASGKSKAAFDADCRAGTETIPTAAAHAAPAAAQAAPSPADPMAPKPLMPAAAPSQ